MQLSNGILHHDMTSERTKYHLAAIQDADHLVPRRFIVVDLEQLFNAKALVQTLCQPIVRNQPTLFRKRQETLTGFALWNIQMLLPHPAKETDPLV